MSATVARTRQPIAARRASQPGPTPFPSRSGQPARAAVARNRRCPQSWAQRDEIAARSQGGPPGSGRPPTPATSGAAGPARARCADAVTPRPRRGRPAAPPAADVAPALVRRPSHAAPAGPGGALDPPPPGRRRGPGLAGDRGGDGRRRRADPVLGVRLGRRARAGPLPRRSARTRSAGGASSTSRPAAGSSRSRRPGPARRASLAADIDPFAEAAVAPQRPGERRPRRVRRRATCWTRRRRTSTSCSPPTPGTRARSPSGCCRGSRAAADRGIRVLVGDPGRRYLPDGRLDAARDVRGRDDDRARGPRRR